MRQLKSLSHINLNPKDDPISHMNEILSKLGLTDLVNEGEYRVLRPGDLKEEAKNVWKKASGAKKEQQNEVSRMFKEEIYQLLSYRDVRHEMWQVDTVVSLGHVLVQRKHDMSKTLGKIQAAGGLDGALYDQIVIAEWIDNDEEIHQRMIDGQGRSFSVCAQFLSLYGPDRMDEELANSDLHVPVRIVTVDDEVEASILFVLLQHLREPIKNHEKAFAGLISGDPVTVYAQKWLTNHGIGTKQLNKKSPWIMNLEHAIAVIQRYLKHIKKHNKDFAEEKVLSIDSGRNFSLIPFYNDAIQLIKNIYGAGTQIPVQGFMIVVTLYYVYNELFIENPGLRELFETYLKDHYAVDKGVVKPFKKVFTVDRKNTVEMYGFKDFHTSFEQWLRSMKYISRTSNAMFKNTPFRPELITKAKHLLDNSRSLD